MSATEALRDHLAHTVAASAYLKATLDGDAAASAALEAQHGKDVLLAGVTTIASSLVMSQSLLPTTYLVGLAEWAASALANIDKNGIPS